MLKYLLGKLGTGPAPAPADRPEAAAQQLILQGQAAEDAGDAQAALALYRRAVELAPALPAAHLNLGIAHEALGDPHAARAAFRQVLVLDSGHPYGCYNLAKLDYLQARPEAARGLLQRALARKRDFAEAWVLLSNVRDALDDLAGAAEALAEALQLRPDWPGALLNFAGVLERLGRIDEAADAAARAATLEPSPASLALHSHLLAAQGFPARALAPLREAIGLAPQRFDLRSRELFLLTFLDGPTPREIFEWHRAYGEDVERQVQPLPAERGPSGPRRLRIGYVSGDLRVHPVALFLLPALERRNRERLEVWCYSSTVQADHVTRRIESLSDHWVDAVGWSDAQLAQAIAGDGIDVLVDLGGHTGEVRLGVFAQRPAPVQASWLGYLNTTGLSRMDFRLSDARCDPPQVSQPLHTERLLLLPHSQWCYRPFIEVPPADAAPCERNGFITFGSFNNVGKVDEAMAARWGRILRAVPQSRLLVAGAGSAAKRESLLGAITAEGVAAERVRFAPRQDLHAYYRTMNEVDVALDSWPYGGGTTTFDVLWMGVPVLTASGETPASRSAASILAGLGLDAWVAADITGYERLARERAVDANAIAHLRRTLRKRLQASAFMDEQAFVAALEAAFVAAWRERGTSAAR